jgi:hypothetical protein
VDNDTASQIVLSLLCMANWCLGAITAILIMDPDRLRLLAGL